MQVNLGPKTPVVQRTPYVVLPLQAPTTEAAKWTVGSKGVGRNKSIVAFCAFATATMPVRMTKKSSISLDESM